MYTLLIVFIVFAALLMIGIVLIQESKGGGLASNFASYNQIGGVRKTTDFIEKATWTLAGVMVALSIVCAYVAPKANENGTAIEKIQINQQQNTQQGAGYDIPTQQGDNSQQQ